MRARPRPYTFTDYKLKPFSFPDNFVLHQDTREQRPLFTRLPPGLIIRSCTLQNGDYSIRGHEDRIAFERKGISDLVSYCTSEREKTIAKMKRFMEYEFAALVIECKEAEILRPYEFSKVSPETIRQTLVSFEVKAGVHVYYGSRESCARWILDRCIKFYRLKREV